jgi:hypothetical protein
MPCKLLGESDFRLRTEPQVGRMIYNRFIRGDQSAIG